MTTITKSRPKPTRNKSKRSAAKSKGKPKPSRDIKWLDVADLHVSKLNMRHGKDAPDIDDIYPSILESGVHQSLLVRKEGKGYGVIADAAASLPCREKPRRQASHRTRRA